jgi:hypothetical protein
LRFAKLENHYLVSTLTISQNNFLFVAALSVILTCRRSRYVLSSSAPRLFLITDCRQAYSSARGFTVNVQAVRFAVGLVVGVGSVLAMACSAVAAPTLDTATQGNWVGVYGSSGHILPDYTLVGSGVYTNPKTTANDLTSLPSWVSSYSYSGAEGYLWQSGVADIRAPQNPLNPGGVRAAATAFSGGGFTMNVLLNKATEFQLGVYGLDWDANNARQMTVSVNGEPLLFDDFANGVWGLWDLNLPAGAFTISVSNSGSPNATISAITFDEILAVPEPSAVALWLALGSGGMGLALWQRSRRAPSRARQITA